MIKPDLSPQKVLQALPKSRERGISVDRLAKELYLSESQAARLDLFLKEFLRVGLAASKGGRYWRRQAPGLVIGTLKGKRSGYAVVVPEEPEETGKGGPF